jgi:hypothetical protein
MGTACLDLVIVQVTDNHSAGCRQDPQRTSKILTATLLGVSLLTLLLVYSGTDAVDAGSCAKDLVISRDAGVVLLIGVGTAGVLASTLFVVAVTDRLASRWRYVLAIPLGLATIAALGATALLLPTLGLLPGLDCTR